MKRVCQSRYGREMAVLKPLAADGEFARIPHQGPHPRQAIVEGRFESALMLPCGERAPLEAEIPCEDLHS